MAEGLAARANPLRSRAGRAGTVTVSASHPVLGQASAALRVWQAAG